MDTWIEAGDLKYTNCNRLQAEFLALLRSENGKAVITIGK